MFKNIENKLKDLAYIVFALVTLGGVGGGITLIVVDDDFIALGIILIVLSWVIGMLSAWPIYGIGEAVELARANNELLLRNKKSSNKSQNEKKQVKATEPEQENRKSESVSSAVKAEEVNISDVETELGKCDICKKEDQLLKCKIIKNNGISYMSLCNDCYVNILESNDFIELEILD